MAPIWPMAEGTASASDRRRDGDGGALAVGAEIARHPPDRLGDDGDRDDLQAVQPGGAGKIAERRRPRKPNRINASADGIVKPSQAAKAPGNPGAQHADR